NFSTIEQKGIKIFGLSRDSIKVHENFKAKHDFPFELISDKDESICQLFDVIKEKKMYGYGHKVWLKLYNLMKYLNISKEVQS
ncbi:MAG: redoxin domain-containing protein, partial [Deltaproteobacteria bacterium]|nr:redoxin domain-containing protein [Deltaproteobacteria bacterium]